MEDYQKDPKECTSCGSEYELSRYCGAWVCVNDECGHHKGLVRRYCGWAADGGNGRQQLQEMGETIEEDDY